MGACFSRDRQASGRLQSATAQAPDPGVSRQVYEQAVAPGSGLHVAVSSARCSGAAAAGGDAVLVKTTPGHVFVALFEGLGEHGAAVAAFCRSAVWAAFQECAVRHPGEPLEQLRATLERLDGAIFATDRLKHAVGAGSRGAAAAGGSAAPRRALLHPAPAPRPSRPPTARPPCAHALPTPTALPSLLPRRQAKARSGASAVLVLLDLRGGRAHCANVGAAACLLARITGSFQAKAPEGFFLSADHTTRWVGARVGACVPRARAWRDVSFRVNFPLLSAACGGSARLSVP